MQASSPTWVCGIAGFVVFPLAAPFVPVRRGVIYCARRRVSEANRRAAAALRPEIPPAGVRGGAGCGGMRASRPTAIPYVPHQPGTPRVSDARNLCRGGFHIRPVRGSARFPGRCKHRPLHGFAVSQGLLFSRLAASFIPVRRGGIYPSRGRLRRGEVPGTMQASSPTWVCDIAGFVVFPLAAPFVPVRRGGIYCARRRVSEANRTVGPALRP